MMTPGAFFANYDADVTLTPEKFQPVASIDQIFVICLSGSMDMRVQGGRIARLSSEEHHAYAIGAVYRTAQLGQEHHG